MSEVKSRPLGQLRDQDDLLSLTDEALRRRDIMRGMVEVLASAVIVGNQAPVVTNIWERMSNPQIGDLVVEVSRWRRTDPVDRAYSLGYLIARRDEGGDDVWYVQYGPEPHDVCRWANCSFYAVLTEKPKPDVSALRVGSDSSDDTGQHSP